MLSKIVISTYRAGNYIYYGVQLPILKQILFFIYKLWNFFLMNLCLNCEIPAKAKIGAGLKIYHPYGIIINESVVLGKNVVLRHQVTIGNKGNGSPGCPIIGDNVNIGTGVTIIGNIRIGENVSIGANSVVTKDIPENVVIAGVPAKSLIRLSIYKRSTLYSYTINHLEDLSNC